MTIVVNVLDRLGKTVDLERFDVEANLSVVILDPLREASDARIGRWDFSPGEVARLTRNDHLRRWTLIHHTGTRFELMVGARG